MNRSTLLFLREAALMIVVCAALLFLVPLMFQLFGILGGAR
jgi:hypothetical protein